MNEPLALLISLATWLTPSPAHASGLLVYYGPDWLAQANADFRGYTLQPYRDQCGLSVMSPSDLGKIVWVRHGQYWYGPCLAVDVGARHDFYDLVFIKREIAEVTTTLRDRLRFKHGASAPGEIYIGLCPPDESSRARPYAPRLSYSSEPNPYFVWPRQQMPVDCENLATYNRRN